MQIALGCGPLGAGLRLMPWSGLLMTCAPMGGALADRIGERPLAVGGLLMQTIGMGWLALIAGPDLAYSQMLLPMVASGRGLSIAMPHSPTGSSPRSASTPPWRSRGRSSVSDARPAQGA